MILDNCIAMSTYESSPPNNCHYIHHLLTPQHPSNSPDNSPPSLQPDQSTTTASRGRSRGRPPGSKNKPKPPIILSQDPPNSLQSHILHISAGTDIIFSLSEHSRRRARGICVLSATGTVADPTILQPTGNNAVTLQGRFEILSFSGTMLPPPAPPGASGLTIFLSGGNGVVVGGVVVGRLVALSPVVLMAGLCSNLVFERLPLEYKEEKEEEGGGDDNSNNDKRWKDDVSHSLGVTGGNSGVVPFNHVGGNNNNNNPFLAADLFGWGGSASPRPSF